MSRPRDLQIFWVVAIGAGFWVAIWQHDIVANVWNKVSARAMALTSGFRPAPAREPPPLETAKRKTKETTATKD